MLFFGAGSSLQNVTDAVNANTDATGVSASITTAAVASTVTLGVIANNNALQFTDARQNAGASDPAMSSNGVVGTSREVLLASSLMNARPGDESREGVSLTNLDQPLFEGANATKRELVDYLDGVRDRIIPVLA